MKFSSYLECQEVIGQLRWASHFTGTLQAQQQQVQHQSIVLCDEGGELQATQDTIGVGVVHVLVGDDHVVLGCHVVSNVVVHDQTQQPVHQSQVNLLVHLVELALQQDIALALVEFPDLLQVVDACT